MKQRFETFVTAISSINRSLQRLKSTEMADFGLKGTHVMCLYQLQEHSGGLTAGELSRLCDADKAAISRAISELREQDLVWMPEEPGRRYRQPIRLTERGQEVTAVMDQKIADAAMPVLPYRLPQILDSVSQVPDLLRSAGISGVLLITDQGIRSHGLTAGLETRLWDLGIRCAVYDRTVANPTSDNVEQARGLYLREHCGAAALGAGGLRRCHP